MSLEYLVVEDEQSSKLLFVVVVVVVLVRLCWFKRVSESEAQLVISCWREVMREDRSCVESSSSDSRRESMWLYDLCLFDKDSSNS